MLFSRLFSVPVQFILLSISFVPYHLANSQKFLGPQVNSEISHTISKTTVLILKPDGSAALNATPDS